MRRFKKLLALAFILCCLLSLLIIPAHAKGSFSFYGSGSTARVGETYTFTVTMKGRDATVGYAKLNFGFHTDLLKYVSHSASDGVTCRVDGGSISLEWNNTNGADSAVCTISFIGLAEGTRVTSFNPLTANDINGDMMNRSLTTTIIYTILPANFPGGGGGGDTGEAPRPPAKSSEARLSTLSVDNAVLSPEFSSGTYEYTTTVPAGTTTAALTAATKDSKASFTVSDTALAIGENEITITATAEDGTTKYYTITITRPQDPIPLPEGMTLTGAENRVIAVDGNGNEAVYIYDPASNTLSLWVNEADALREELSALQEVSEQLQEEKESLTTQTQHLSEDLQETEQLLKQRTTLLIAVLFAVVVLLVLLIILLVKHTKKH